MTSRSSRLSGWLSHIMTFQVNVWFLLSIPLLTSPTQTQKLLDHAFNPKDYMINQAEGYVFFEIVEPEELSYTYKMNQAAFSTPWNNTFHGIPLVPSDPACGCGSYFNAEDVEGHVALVDRGECSFVSKALKAQEAGAVGIVITDQNENNDELYIIMQDDTTERKVQIPAGFLLGKNGHIIKNTLHRLRRREAIINIPINITNVQIHKQKQPPWIVW
ncbi:PRADC1-like protein isoform X1 [Tigriopus californicus]|uniref:PRADC1-like protein isoform X1 n=1 Tax=Tigriopus californicus TaxID=6832 RepID=UPI0027DA8A71|nr:PRADC1-like protein isoform X1 [Tigriopus californicus]